MVMMVPPLASVIHKGIVKVACLNDHQHAMSGFLWHDLLVGAAVVASIGVMVVLML